MQITTGHRAAEAKGARPAGDKGQAGRLTRVCRHFYIVPVDREAVDDVGSFELNGYLIPWVYSQNGQRVLKAAGLDMKCALGWSRKSSRQWNGKDQ
jgi:hypothetical protein